MYHSVLFTESQDHVLPLNVEVVLDEENNVKLAKRRPTSRAISLGAPISAAGVVNKACARRSQDRSLFTCVNIPDEIAMMGCLGFAGLCKMTTNKKQHSDYWHFNRRS